MFNDERLARILLRTNGPQLSQFAVLGFVLVLVRGCNKFALA